ncbi:MAG: preprotein translocase subunit SecG [Oscillospiraceae bacterium]|nr:preprotein translocase subunit SecG [Oscillospiraceae bacterium]
MSFFKTFIVVIDLIVALILMAIVIIQSGKTSGLSGALTGGSDTFLSKNSSRSLDARLARATKWFAGVFFVLTIILNCIA